jgi:hypothetical protein
MTEVLNEEYAIPDAGVVELDSRREDAIEVTMVWRPERDSIEIGVNDTRTGEAIVIEPPNEKALDAFHHPYAYVAGSLAVRDSYTPEGIAA